MGDLLVEVKSAVDEKPIAGARVIVRDQPAVRPPITLITAAGWQSPALHQPASFARRKSHCDNSTATAYFP